jgi:sugar phosphate isomerase/epimerase
MPRLSLAQLTIDPVSINGLIAAAAGAGFDAINPRVRAVADKGPSVIPVREMKQRLDDSGLSVLALTSFWITPDTNPEDIESIADAAAAFGAPFIQSVINDEDEGRALSNFSRVCEIVAERGLTLAIEFLGYVAVPSLAATASFIKASGQRNAGVCLDALALARAGETPADVAACDPKLFSYVQICDGPRKSPPRDQLRNEARALRLYPGEGELPIDGLIDALPPDIPVDVEAPVAADAELSPELKAKKAADKTRSFLQKYRRRTSVETRT